MINKEDIVFEAKVSGYYFYYDGNFISMYDEQAIDNKNANCVSRLRTNCKTKKDFELETIYMVHNL
jgi:hypothetical protein